MFCRKIHKQTASTLRACHNIIMLFCIICATAFSLYGRAVTNGCVCLCIVVCVLLALMRSIFMGKSVIGMTHGVMKQIIVLGVG